MYVDEFAANRIAANEERVRLRELEWAARHAEQSANAWRRSRCGAPRPEREEVGIAEATPRYRTVFGLVVVPSIVVAGLMGTLYLIVMPAIPAVGHYYFSQQERTYASYQVPLLIHIAAGAIALILGPINLIGALRRSPGRRHQAIGKLYAVAVAVAATGAVFMSFHAYPGTMPGGRLIVTSGFFTLGIAWLATLVLAVRAIALKHDIGAHRFWIIANFSLTFVAVVLRVENSALLLTGTFETLYPLLPWSSGIPCVVGGMLLARKLNQRRSRRTPPRRTTNRTAPLRGATALAAFPTSPACAEPSSPRE